MTTRGAAARPGAAGARRSGRRGPSPATRREAARTVVLGGGLAGAAAALELAARGMAPVLVRAAPGATALCWGSLDAAGASPDPAGLPWRDPVRGEPLSPSDRLAFVLESRRGHPYTVLFPERDRERAARATKEAFAALDGWLRPHGCAVEGSLDESRLLATVRGAVRVCDFALAEVAAGDLARAGRVDLVEIPGLPGHAAGAVARMLAAELEALGVTSPVLRVVRVELPAGLAEHAAHPARLAAALDAPEAARALAARCAGGGGATLLFPPVLGLAPGVPARRVLAEAAGGPVAELLGAPPWSPAGLRLDRALTAALDAAGVERRGARAVGVERHGGRVAALHLGPPDPPGEAPASSGPDERLELDALVLATGRFVGGGLAERDGLLAETVLGLPVCDERGRRLDGQPAHRQLRRRYADPQPLFAAGVRVDGRLRPLDALGRPAWANVAVAGDLLAGFDPALQRTGMGVALLSGRRAGEEAARLAEETAAARREAGG